MRVSAGLRAGRTHRERDEPCQDAFAAKVSAETGRVAAAVGDGLGSRRLSHEGSQVATRAAVDSLLGARRLGPAAMHRAFATARRALRRRALELGVTTDDLATTLHAVVVGPEGLIAGSVGDGAILSLTDAQPRVLMGPEASEYTNEVVPITVRPWRDYLRIERDEAATGALLFTDGLTRLLMTRRNGSWEPFPPFFDAFLPKMSGKTFDSKIVGRFLDQDAVDRAWDDDKCLVVIGHGSNGNG